MQFLNTLSIRSKLVIAMLMAVIISTSIVGFVGHSKAKELLISRLQQSDLPNLLLRVRNAVNGEISEMKVLTKSIATNPFLLDWIESGANKENEANVIKMLNKIAKDNNLSNASFADRKTANYWNQDGFLRVLKNDELDGWFFAFTNGGEAESASTYGYPNGNVDVFINYQQINGRGVSGLSKSFNDMVNYLNSFKIEESGFVYLVDHTGLVKIHKDKEKSEKTKITDLYSDINAQTLLTQKDFAFQETDKLIIATSYISSLGWYVVAEVPKEELYLALNESRNYMLMWFAIIVAVFICVSIILAKSLTRPINDLAVIFKELGDGDSDLSYRLNESGGDEVSRLAHGFNAFIIKIHTVVSDVSATSKDVRQASIKVSQDAEQSKVDAQGQRDIAIQVAAAISEMGSTITEIAANAVHAADSTNDATTQAKNAQDIVKESTENIYQMAQKMDSASTTIESLADKSNAISSVLEVIRGISEQTNLLALNAAIEAARAGEQGRGFAVVADEVRNLAKRTSESTDEINKMINLLQSESKRAVDSVRESKETADIAVNDAQQTTEALEDIVANIQQISDLNTQVATSTEEQATVVGEINIHVHAISDSTENSAQISTRIASASESLTAMAMKLDSLVERFKI
ncbi:MULTISPECIES: methyl-accepting chemotaxis protein [unclassified Colwellia]|uniref:methyl-accepting chemotaxis protein n=1 Tax=unclassified Colwellia TaxID=196834 RepID=UPI0015F5DC6A|nr:MULTISPECIES: methyl-accepting chemotaxis protein [unclassified Colwellia]MBA6233784.1 methyl-accepting chemotaxis protein [Colwellia sp. MB02u-7]MBA6237400.1 methyl-accepting chemotaxis protein [Colwellia sp. MB02u-11]MBA6257150.1 methyl-accepting chemotaxis protein [Colwellia sp. MB3u-28]MBA6258735.1 methyl-accepting chemotaxis protein [Colwellia sp. MB3u-41]MBA6300400.1 methyl-accepting chemotaxis protein [Colwellia sp. MB3u-22]